MTTLTGTLVPAKIVPHDDADTYPTHSETYGEGGFRTVANTDALNAIPAARIKDGMLVFVRSSGLVMQWDATLVTPAWVLFSAGSGGGGGSLDTTELRYLGRQYANLMMTLAESSLKLNRNGNFFADGFEVSTYIRTGGGLASSNYQSIGTTDSDTDGKNDYVIRPSRTASLTLMTGTPIGSMNLAGSGGVTVAFDGTAGAGAANTARFAQSSGTQQFAWIGLDMGSAKSINKVVITPDTTGGFEVTGQTYTPIQFNIYGSNELPDAITGSGGASERPLANVKLTKDQVAAVTLTIGTNSPTYRYVYAKIQGVNGANWTYAVSQMQIYENAGAINNMTLYGGLTASTPFKVAAPPAYWRIWVDMQSTDLSFDINTDFTAYASRNGGTNFQQLPLSELVGDSGGPIRLMRSAWIDCSAGHSPNSPCTLATKFVSANNHDFNFRRYLFEWRYS